MGLAVGPWVVSLISNKRDNDTPKEEVERLDNANYYYIAVNTVGLSTGILIYILDLKQYGAILRRTFNDVARDQMN